MSASPGPDAAGDRDGPDPVAAVRRPWLTRNVAVLSGVSFLQDTASEMLYPILPVFLTAVLGAPVAVVGIVEGAADGAAALAKVAAGRFADRTGRRPVSAGSPGVRVNLAVASAANTAVCSCLTSSSRIGGSAFTAASYSGKTCPPDSVNIVVTPCPARRGDRVYARRGRTVAAPGSPDAAPGSSGALPRSRRRRYQRVTCSRLP